MSARRVVAMAAIIGDARSGRQGNFKRPLHHGQRVRARPVMTTRATIHPCAEGSPDWPPEPASSAGHNGRAGPADACTAPRPTPISPRRPSRPVPPRPHRTPQKHVTRPHARLPTILHSRPTQDRTTSHAADRSLRPSCQRRLGPARRPRGVTAALHEERASITVGTNLPFSEWGTVFPDPASSPPPSTASPSAPTSSMPAPSPAGSPPGRPAGASEPARGFAAGRLWPPRAGASTTEALAGLTLRQ